MTTMTLTMLLGVLVMPPAKITVELEFGGLRMSPRLESAAMTEVRSIWAEYGVDVRVVAPETPVSDGVIRLWVALANDLLEQGTVYTLGVTRFIGDRPQPSIVMYPQAIDTLVTDGLLIRGDAAASVPPRREQLLGQVFGRALAHEIGHVLLQSRHHTPHGLMRARPSVAALLNQDRHPFDLSAGEVTALHALLRFSN